MIHLLSFNKHDHDDDDDNDDDNRNVASTRKCINFMMVLYSTF
jgi:hypothetical protein